ncbi:hypothetical protein [Streptomyces sp. NPDC051214]|uniref:hypothetical protein n=1 Tax=Streptomyces sp. NPDC051214 TaxID=3155282 RepID=UPI003443F06B
MSLARVVDWIEPGHLPPTLFVIATVTLAVVLVRAYVDRAKPAEDDEAETTAKAQRRLKRSIVGIAAGGVAFVIAAIWAPWWIEDRHLRDKRGDLVASAGIIVTGFRTTLVAVAAGGLTAAGLYFTRKKHDLEQEQFQHAQKQFKESQAQFETTLRETQERDIRQDRMTREGQVTGRYVEAIKLLGSEREHEVLGGIYSLERIMIDSEDDRSTIVEVLAAYVRT